jgi:quaternary ammonium compound-resistance protein SugE
MPRVLPVEGWAGDARTPARSDIAIRLVIQCTDFKTYWDDTRDGHNTNVAWFLLLIAGVMEVCWAIGLKYTDGFTRLTPTLLTIGAMVISMGLLGLSVRELPIGTAYAVWTGIGAIGTVVAGTVLLNEPMSFLRGFCILLIFAGIIGLKLTHT